MKIMNEQFLENYCMAYFEQIGYQTAYGPDILTESINPLRQNIREPFLPTIVKNKLEQLNPNTPTPVLEDAFHILTHTQETTLIAKNEQIHNYLVNGIKIPYKNNFGEDITYIIKIIDFDNYKNNDFLAVNQFKIQGTINNRRPDIVVFINGLPLAVIELKNPADENTTIYNAFNQIQTYKNDIPDLFDYNLACIISDGFLARIGSISANIERFMPWRTIDGETRKGVMEDEAQTLIKGFFNKEYILDYLRYFVLFEREAKKTIKKIAGYHQFHAGRKTVKSVLSALQNNSRQGGVIWHTTGSGKSLSMVCIARKIMQTPQMKNPTIIMITDRNDLDGQLFDTFASSLQDLTPKQAQTREELQTMLKNIPSGSIIFTTMQKFLPQDDKSTFPLLSDRHNIVVISDEAHRTQYGFEANFKNGKLKYGYAKYLRDAFPNACFVGFTGTPISQTDRDTRAVFGEYVDIYDMQDAIKDGATVKIYYEARHIQLNTRDVLLKQLDKKVEELTSNMTNNDTEKLRYATIEKLAGLPDRLKELATDLVSHFENRLKLIDGKGLIVCMSREIAVKLYDEIIKIRPTWHSDDYKQGFIKVIMTGSASDPQNYQKHIYNFIAKKEIENRMKDPQDPLKLVIVCDMWLTGFDVPSLHTMYIDKPIRAHNLIQAISRVNRVFKDKPSGLVVDYIGMARALEDAVRDYTRGGGHGDVAVNVKRAYEELLSYMDVCRSFLKGFDYSEFNTKPYDLVSSAWNYILKNAKDKETVQKTFADNVLSAVKAYGLCQSLPEVAKLNEELAFFNLLKTAISKKETDKNKKSIDEIKSIIGDIISKAIATDKPIDIFEQVGLDKPNLSLVDEKFLEKIHSMKHKDLVAELLRRLVEGEIKSKFRLNASLQKRFSEKLKETVNKYNNGSIETVQVIEELISIAKETNEAIRQGEKLGLSEKELAFYNALEENESSVRELGNDTLKKIAQELMNYLRNSIKIDWSKRESVKAGIRKEIKKILRKYDYPPDKEESATKRVLEQAEIVSDDLVG